MNGTEAVSSRKLRPCMVGLTNQYINNLKDCDVQDIRGGYLPIWAYRFARVK